MYEPDENRGVNNDSYDAPSGYVGETDRVSGEYHYKNGYTQRIYSDAHYRPAEDTTVPPRYYQPPERKQSRKSEREPKKRQRRRTRRTFGIVVLCIACIAFGAAAGSFAVMNSLSAKIDRLETDLSAANEAISESTEIHQEMSRAAVFSEEAAEDSTADSNSYMVTAESELSGLENKATPSAVYDMACTQVVGITTDVTYTNYFGRTSSSAVTGTGFFISEDGYILTNYHVIEYAYQYGYAITVMTHDGTRYNAAIVGAEEANDIAILKVDILGANAVSVADSSELKVGDEVYAVGNPLGELEFSMTFGRVSALDRMISTNSSDSAINMFQFDAAVNSGNSGGPLYDTGGHVVGIVTAKYSSSGVEGLGFAIPINDASAIANDVIKLGYVTGKASLGASFDSRFTSIYSMYYGLPEGAYVSSVESGSCAEAAGIQKGDIIVQIGSTTIKSYTEVKTVLRRCSAGETVTVTVYRQGSTRELNVTLDEYIPPAAAH